MSLHAASGSESSAFGGGASPIGAAAGSLTRTPLRFRATRRLSQALDQHSQPESAESKLQPLRKLLDDGQITPEVYQRAREKVLEAVRAATPPPAAPEPEPEVEPLGVGDEPLYLDDSDDDDAGAEGLLALRALSEQASAAEAAAATDAASEVASSATSDLAFR